MPFSGLQKSWKVEKRHFSTLTYARALEVTRPIPSISEGKRLTASCVRPVRLDQHRIETSRARAYVKVEKRGFSTFQDFSRVQNASVLGKCKRVAPFSRARACGGARGQQSTDPTGRYRTSWPTPFRALSPSESSPSSLPARVVLPEPYRSARREGGVASPYRSA